MNQATENNNTALLIMDVQGQTVARLKDSNRFFNSLTSVIQAARKNKYQIIYVVIGFRKGYPEASPYNKSFSSIKTRAMNFDNEESSRVHFSVAPQPEDIVVTKRRVSAFTGSDLEVVLRSLDIKQLVLSGIATSGVVLSTLREAADKDYLITVLSDCCEDMDEEVHNVLMTKVFPRQAEVITSEIWIETCCG